MMAVTGPAVQVEGRNTMINFNKDIDVGRFSRHPGGIILDVD
jgi:hypothetical protein